MIIGVGGPKAHGKSTFSQFLQKHSSKGLDLVEMSAPVLESLLTMNVFLDNGVRIRDMFEHVDYDYAKLKENKEVRRLLQAIGTDVGRNMIDMDVWVNMARAKCRESELQGRNAILTGIRFDNELALADKSFYILRPLPVVDAHISEHSLAPKNFDIVVNNVTLEQLELTAQEIVREHNL